MAEDPFVDTAFEVAGGSRGSEAVSRMRVLSSLQHGRGYWTWVLPVMLLAMVLLSACAASWSDKPTFFAELRCGMTVAAVQGLAGKYGGMGLRRSGASEPLSLSVTKNGEGYLIHFNREGRLFAVSDIETKRVWEFGGVLLKSEKSEVDYNTALDCRPPERRQMR